MNKCKYEFLNNGSYCYHVLNGVVLFHVTIRSLDEEGNLVERKSLDMVDTEMTVEEFEKKNMATHIEGTIPEDFFPAEVWVDDADEMDEEDAEGMLPIFEIVQSESISIAPMRGTFSELIETYRNLVRQWRWGLFAQCPQMILVDVLEGITEEEYAEISEESDEEATYEEIGQTCLGLALYRTTVTSRETGEIICIEEDRENELGGYSTVTVYRA